MQQLRRPTRAERRTDRTTKMLLAILLLFLITEFPQGILGLLSGILGHSFFSSCYHLFGEVMDILALLNGAINFILYCAMSRQFRTTFGQLFKPRGLMAKLHAVHGPNTSQTEVGSLVYPTSCPYLKFVCFISPFFLKKLLSCFPLLDFLSIFWRLHIDVFVK
ncbi:Myosuppressin Receptor 2 part 2-RA [Frankliniella occidentalis]|nr:Myosuppressin Receptor 2 part 2-RA [Frankliniella occidentalis]